MSWIFNESENLYYEFEIDIRKENTMNKNKRLAIEKLENDGLNIRRYEAQTEAMCLAAVRQNGFALEYVKEQTDEICLAAVQKNGCALEYVKDQTEELCLEATNRYPKSIRHIKDDEMLKQVLLELRKQSL